MKITLQQVQTNIADIANRHEYTKDVIYELLAAYGRSKSAITQLREGHLNKAEGAHTVLQKDVVYFKIFEAGTPLEHEVIELYEDPLTQRYNPRYLIATDLTNIAAKDMIKGNTISIKLADIDNELEFFYGWTGDEITKTGEDTPANRQAAEKMNELYVEIEKQNHSEFATNPNFRHELNTFFTRLLFCFFAEDTGIYNKNQFTGALKTYTQTDGSDLSWFLGELFRALDTKPEDNHTLKSPFKEFPYVNGSIFNTSKHAIAIPKFSPQARHLILECGRQNWGKIDPDIFGTIFQGVVDPEHRDENGMDYTSVPNIMKVIKPLFLDNLREEFDKCYDSEKKLWALLGRVQKIKIFDPACGSGNFLIIAYKELRQLQHAVIGRVAELRPTGLPEKSLPDNQLININNFYGIEIDDFAHELAVLSLFLAKHQMNQEFTEQFGKALSIIPLIDIPTIVHGNAARLDWQEVCANVPHQLNPTEQLQMGLEIDGLAPAEQQQLLTEYIYDEIYLIGNPPYKGSRGQSNLQKDDMKTVFDGIYDKYKLLDYIFIWLYKGYRYIEGTKAELAFLSTNSVSQGEQVSIAWPDILSYSEIGFAYPSFLWRNSARDQAGVFCVIICLRNMNSKKPKYIFSEDIRNAANRINAYLVNGEDAYVYERSYPLSFDLIMQRGSELGDNKGNLSVSLQERDDIINRSPETRNYFREIINADSVINNRQKRYGIWLEGIDPETISDDAIRERIRRVAEKRPDKPWLFSRISVPNKRYLFIPQLSSERREYIPTSFFDETIIPLGPHFFIDGANLLEFSVISSRMHMAWMRAVSGKFKKDYRYASGLVYNTFPLHPLTEAEKGALSEAARSILLARATHPEKTLADMYDPDKMPADLREAHDENDHLVDNLYKKGGFTNDEDRLAALFGLYEQMTAKERVE